MGVDAGELTLNSTHIDFLKDFKNGVSF